VWRSAVPPIGLDVVSVLETRGEGFALTLTVHITPRTRPDMGGDHVHVQLLS
jgi:hypothetical protein